VALRDVLRSVLPEGIRNAARKPLREVRWVLDELVVSPAWAIFCRRRGRLNGQFFARVKAETARGHDAQLDPYRPSDIPRIVWMYWDKGEEAAPDLVRYCIRSWREHNPGWDVRVLDSMAAERLADFSVLSGKPFPQRFHADVLRLQLLSGHGGVWADATVLCHRPLDGWLPLSASQGFFAFGDAGPDRLVESWFIASEPRGALVSAWRDAYVAELARVSVKPRYYFVVMYAFEWALRRNPSIAAAWRRCPRIPAPPCFVAASALQGRTDRAIAVDLIRKGLPVSKLSWKVPIPLAEVERLVADARGVADA
jgi:hypothetical protein